MKVDWPTACAIVGVAWAVCWLLKNLMTDTVITTYREPDEKP